MLPKLNYKKTELSFIIKMRVFTIYIYKLLMNLIRSNLFELGKN